MQTPLPNRTNSQRKLGIGSLLAFGLAAFGISGCRSTHSGMADWGRSLTFGLFEKNYSEGGVTSLEKQRDFERRASSQNTYQQSMSNPIRD